MPRFEVVESLSRRDTQFNRMCGRKLRVHSCLKQFVLSLHVKSRVWTIRVVSDRGRALKPLSGNGTVFRLLTVQSDSLARRVELSYTRGALRLHVARRL